jgi:hypothetical protein
MTDSTNGTHGRRMRSGRERRAAAPGRGPITSLGALRLLGIMVFAGALAWLAWQVVVNVSPRDLATGDESAAEAFAGDRTAALLRRAASQVFEAEGAVDWAEVRTISRHVLRVQPLESHALVLLGLAAEAEGRGDEALALMSIAARRSLRNRGAHLWLFNHRLRQRDFGTALSHADVILRTRPGEFRATLLQALMAIASVPGGRTHLVEMLETGPPWRSGFLREFSRHAPDPSDPSQLYAALQSGPHPPNTDELRPHLDALIGSGRFEQALLVWLNSLPPGEAVSLDYLYNGNFERPISNLPFDWIIGSIRGAEINIVESPVDGVKALRVQFARARVAFRHVRKLVMLPPGAYELTGRARADDFRNDRGLSWTLACAEGSKEVLVSTARVSGTMTAEIAEQFTVPAQGCRAQWLQLELAARISSEQDVGGGTVWYDSLQIQRIDALAPS